VNLNRVKLHSAQLVTGKINGKGHTIHATAGTEREQSYTSTNS